MSHLIPAGYFLTRWQWVPSGGCQVAVRSPRKGAIGRNLFPSHPRNPGRVRRWEGCALAAAGSRGPEGGPCARVLLPPSRSFAFSTQRTPRSGVPGRPLAARRRGPRGLAGRARGSARRSERPSRDGCCRRAPALRIGQRGDPSRPSVQPGRRSSPRRGSPRPRRNGAEPWISGEHRRPGRAWARYNAFFAVASPPRLLQSKRARLSPTWEFPTLTGPRKLETPVGPRPGAEHVDPAPDAERLLVAFR